MKRRTKSNLVISPTKILIKNVLIKELYSCSLFFGFEFGFFSHRAHINKYYVAHVFKTFMETSPIDYLIEKRTAVSKILLETTDYSMEQISRIVGFTSQSYFNQILKKRVGMTPKNIEININSKRVPHLLNFKKGLT